MERKSGKTAESLLDVLREANQANRQTDDSSLLGVLKRLRRERENEARPKRLSRRRAAPSSVRIK